MFSKNKGVLMKSIMIGERKIGDGEKPFLVAEIGSNHCGDLSLALEHIDAASEAGAEAVKFQSIRLDRLYYDPSPSIRKLHQKIDLQENWIGRLMEYATKRGVIFHSSPTYLEAVDFLESLDVSFYKLASAQVGTFPPLVERVAALGKPTFLSTGIATRENLDGVIDLFRRAGNEQFVVLHCNSLYPTPNDKVYLPRMAEYAKRYQCLVGYSDHTIGNSISVAAVAMGASVIERHFILSSDLDSPDASVSLNPEQFKQLTCELDEVHAALSTPPAYELEEEEEVFKARIRYRLVVLKDLKPKETFTRDCFDFLRHEDGIDVTELEKVLAHGRVRTPIRAGELLKPENIEYTA